MTGVCYNSYNVHVKPPPPHLKPSTYDGVRSILVSDQQGHFLMTMLNTMY